MMTFESDLFPVSHVRVIPKGQPDQLDVWFEGEPSDEDWGDYFEAMYDPDNPHGYLE